MTTLKERLLSRCTMAEGGCWQWNGGTTGNGYGVIKAGRGNRVAHRVAYELFREPVPRELTCDHLCRNKGCVNPWHIEVVTNRENTLRGKTLAAANVQKTHCDNGHELAGANIYPDDRRRRCRPCSRARARASRERRQPVRAG